MILIPESKTKTGLIQKLHINGVTSAISTNYNISRIKNPITYSSTDRWCSGPVDEYEPAWWQVTFDYWIYPSNYTFQNNDKNVIPTKWKLQAKKEKEWITLHDQQSSEIPNDSYDTFKITNNDGPFRTFRFVSGKNTWSITDESFNFCIYKIDFFGVAFKNLCPLSPYISQFKIQLNIYIIIIFFII